MLYDFPNYSWIFHNVHFTATYGKTSLDILFSICTSKMHIVEKPRGIRNKKMSQQNCIYFQNLSSSIKSTQNRVWHQKLWKRY